MRVLVTGGAGFIGHHLVRQLLDRGDSVAVLDDFSTGSRARTEPFGTRVKLVEGSVLDARALDEAMASCEVVFHHAAIPSVARSIVDPKATHEVNVTGTVELMLAASRNGVRRVVYAGSSSAYGIPTELPCKETMRPAPESPYGVSKLAGEQYTHVIGKHMGVESVVLRYFNVFGPGQDPTSEYAAVVPRFVTEVLDGGHPTINGDGTISRDFTYVDNVVAANLLAASSSRAVGSILNIACGVRTTLIELLEAIGKAADRRVDPIMGPPRPGDIVHSLADITMARSVLGYRVSVPFAEGISATVAWFKDRDRPG